MDKSKIASLFMNMCLEMWSGDCVISYELFIDEVNSRIKNLESSIGEDAHKRLEEMGVVDATGMAWEDQDAFTQNQIEEYKVLLSYLSDDKNWAW